MSHTTLRYGHRKPTTKPRALTSAPKTHLVRQARNRIESRLRAERRADRKAAAAAG